MAYSGIYTLKNRAKYRGDPDNVVFRSLWERSCFEWCDSSSSVIQWASEEVVIPYYYEVDKRYHRYFVDLWIKFENGKVLLVEIKPKKETLPPVKKGKQSAKYLSEALTYVKNQNKWAAADQYCKDRGWEFVTWTEETLYEMGIMRKGLDPIAPLPSFKPLKPLKRDINRRTKNRK